MGTETKDTDRRIFLVTFGTDHIVGEVAMGFTPEQYTMPDGQEGKDAASAFRMEGSIPLNATFALTQSCRTRKRFINLMASTFGMQRNEAAAFAKRAFDAGCPSYQDLWAECFITAFQMALGQ